MILCEHVVWVTDDLAGGETSRQATSSDG
eukprot:COSAG02_NODE_47481_length_340_cov_12.659751_1_plen_28_part_01